MYLKSLTSPIIKRLPPSAISAVINFSMIAGLCFYWSIAWFICGGSFWDCYSYCQSEK